MSYEIILADPPWSYRDSANAGKRGAVHKYRTLGRSVMRLVKQNGGCRPLACPLRHAVK